LTNVESKLEKLTNAVLSKNDLYRMEHPNETPKVPDEAPKEEPKKEEFPVYHFKEEKEKAEAPKEQPK